MVLEIILVTVVGIVTVIYSYKLTKEFSISDLILAYAGATVSLGYFLMPDSTDRYGYDFFSTPYSNYFAISISLFALSFVVMVIVQALISPRYKRNPIKLIVSFNNERAYIAVVTFFVLTSCGALVYIYSKIGATPIASPDSISAKFYLFSNYKILSTLSVNFLSFANFLILVYFIKTKKKGAFVITLFIISNIMLLTTMKRAPLLLPYFYLVFAWILYQGRLAKKHIAIICSVVLIGISMWYIGDAEIKTDKFMKVFSSNIVVEPRELGRVLLASDYMKKTDYAYGKTYIVGLFNVVPASKWDLKKDYYIVRRVAKILGIDYEKSGIPRIGMTGEAYINFGIFGIVFISALFIIIIEIIQNYYAYVKSIDLTKEDKMVMMMFFAVILRLASGFFGSSSSMFLFLYIKLFIVFFLLISGGLKLSWEPVTKQESEA